MPDPQSTSGKKNFYSKSETGKLLNVRRITAHYYTNLYASKINMAPTVTLADTTVASKREAPKKH